MTNKSISDAFARNKVHTVAAIAEAKEASNRYTDTQIVSAKNYVDTNKADKVHTHQISDVVDLQSKLEQLETLASIQPDWNQNNESAKDYIKNRTHYEYADSQTIMETQIIDVSQGGWYQLNIVEGETYTVTVDEIPYECIVGIGNIDELALINDELNEFLEITQEFKGWTFLDYDINGSYEVSIAKNSNGIKQLDEKFIPDTIARKEDIVQQIQAMPMIHYGTTEPDPALGKDGDLYIKYTVEETEG